MNHFPHLLRMLTTPRTIIISRGTLIIMAAIVGAGLAAARLATPLLAAHGDSWQEPVALSAQPQPEIMEVGTARIVREIAVITNSRVMAFVPDETSLDDSRNFDVTGLTLADPSRRLSLSRDTDSDTLIRDFILSGPEEGAFTRVEITNRVQFRSQMVLCANLPLLEGSGLQTRSDFYDFAGPGFTPEALPACSTLIVGSFR